MATTLIDTRKPIMEQIHASWNKFHSDKDSEKKKREEKKVVAWIEATKHSKRDMLKMWKAMERDGYTIRDVIEELERQLD